jgi:hypothetical protein
MSIENTIRYNQTKQFLAYAEQLKAKGEEFIEKLAETLERINPRCFSTSKESATRLRINFFGLSMMVRVEIELDEHESGRLRTYVFDDATPPQLRKLELEYSFDELGNVNRTMTLAEAAGWFPADLLRHLREQKASLPL